KANISERKQEGRQSGFTIAQVTENTIDPAEWGRNFPRQYDSYRRTVDQERTKYGGSEAFQKLDDDAQWKLLFSGYAFAIDYREERGHAYMLQDQRETERVHKKQQPGACVHCHASTSVAYREAGIKAGAPGTLDEALLSKNGKAQLMKGFEDVCKMPYLEATKLVDHPVGCVDCHEPQSMQLRITRPGFLNGIAEFAKSTDPAPHLPSIERWRKEGRDSPYDPNVDASRQEMRSMVCGQCHVEYYFKGEGKVVTYPWANGLKVQQMEAYYDGAGFKDWSHGITGAAVLKAQHPEFELWSQGIHARSGVACADCHMPYVREGAVKVSSHHVRSPLLNISQACLTCHPYSETEMKSRVEAIQDRTRGLMDRAENAVVALIAAIDRAQGQGVSDAALTPARELQRKAQWRLDFVAAENSMGFHAPQESARILGEAIDFARQGEVSVAKVQK
ncbi:MAG: ammonia-forming cytochrome c nitrite reductase subunit c552, partial [Phycisphaerales bacterium]